MADITSKKYKVMADLEFDIRREIENYSEDSGSEEFFNQAFLKR